MPQVRDFMPHILASSLRTSSLCRTTRQAKEQLFCVSAVPREIILGGCVAETR